MRCRFAFRVIEYTATFGKPIFALAQRQTEVLEACFRKTEHKFALDLGDLRAPGGESYADLVVAIGYPRLRGRVEVRVDRLDSRFEGLTLQEEADQAVLFASQCQNAVNDVFPDLLVVSTSINVMSWLTCDGDRGAVEQLLAARQQMQIDAAALGAERARFFVHGQLVNEAQGWSVGFGLEPSVSPEYALYLSCKSSYTATSGSRLISDQAAHLGDIVEGILSQFGFEVAS